MFSLLAVAQDAASVGPADGGSAPTTTARGDRFRIVGAFDFDERKRGNFEATPMHWRRLEGEGLPAYSVGRLDDVVGHAAPPSFLLHLRGGNVAYEYDSNELKIDPHAEYLVEAYIRVAGLEHASAFVACYVTDERGLPIRGSERVSRTVRSPLATHAGEREGDATWERVEIPICSDDPATRVLRVQVWVLQDYCLREAEDAVDPIVPQDVSAHVWLDDLMILRVPRLQLGLSAPGGVITHGKVESPNLSLDVQNTTPVPLTVRVDIRSEHGEQVYHEDIPIAQQHSASPRVELPQLSPGLYQASAELAGPDAPLLRRGIRFVVLPADERLPPPNPRFGVDISGSVAADTKSLQALLDQLGVGAMRIDVPLSLESSVPGLAHLQGVRELAQHLGTSGRECTGTILVSDAPGGSTRATRVALGVNETWSERAAPTLSIAGGHIAYWQLGPAQVDDDASVMSTPLPLSSIRRRIERLVAAPQLVVPASCLDEPPAAAAVATALLGRSEASGSADDIQDAANGAKTQAPSVQTTALDGRDASSCWIPAALPAHAIPWQLAAWGCGDNGGGGTGSDAPLRWVTLELDTDEAIPPAARAADMARRALLAAAFQPARIFLPAPFERVQQGERLLWQPTELFLPMRNLLRLMGNQSVRAALQLPFDSVGLLLEPPHAMTEQEATLVVWTWQTGDTEHERRIELYLGGAPRASVLAGPPVQLEPVATRYRVPLRSMPIFIQNVHGALLLLQDRVRVEPPLVQLHAPEPAPVLTLENTYRSPLVGWVRITPPEGWQVSPDRLTLDLRPGEVRRAPLTFRVPPRETSRGHALSIELHVRQPETLDVSFSRELEVGLHDIQMTVQARWEGQKLLVVQAVRNRSSQPASFRAFCQAPRRARQECLMPDLLSGGIAEQTYILPEPADLAGEAVWVGIEEIEGPRVLDELVLVPALRNNSNGER